jgi:pyridoxal phosphate enzyme (YggS family)
MNSTDRLIKIKADIPSNITIVAVSKNKPASSIEELYLETGHISFGENKAQELEGKHKTLPRDINWHFIGHLQTNKVKYITPFVSVIQSVDSFRLLQEINKAANKNERIIPCLLQFHIAREEAKYGFSIEEAIKMFDDNLFQNLSNITLHGVMGMATYTKDEFQIRSEFKNLYNYFNLLKNRYFSLNPAFCEISMGMTDDYKLAIQEGSTIVRIGSGIFGV